MLNKLLFTFLSLITLNLFCAEANQCISITKKLANVDGTITKKMSRFCTSYTYTRPGRIYEIHKESCKNLCSNKIFCKYRKIIDGIEIEDKPINQSEYLLNFQDAERDFDRIQEESNDE